MKYFTDGYTLGSNPSHGGGYTIVDETGSLIESKVINKEGFTNNEAEILGIEKALELCKAGDTISTDSMNSLSWVFGGKSKARPDLNDRLHYLMLRMIELNINLCWERRDFNLAGLYNEKMKLDTGRPEGWTKRSRKYMARYKRGRKPLTEYQEQLAFLRSI